MKDIERLKKAILDDYPRMTTEDRFKFRCHPGVSCFNDCCADVNIFLTPFDIIKLKNSLGITSGEFLAKYTISPFDENSKFPVLLFKLQDNEKTSCYFVTDKGCSVYNDRPWACRMYPLGLASPKEEDENSIKEFYFLLKEDICQGHRESKNQSIGDWLDSEGIAEYNEMGELFKQITLHDFFEKGKQLLTPPQVEMFYTACYNIDKFRRFIFESSFLDKFDIDRSDLDKIKTDDVEALKLGYKWIRFSLFGEPSIKIKNEAIDAQKKAQEKNQEK